MSAIVKRCDACRFAIPVKDAANLRTVYECRWGPPALLGMPVANPGGGLAGFSAKTAFPHMAADQYCFRYESAVLSGSADSAH